MLLFPAHLTQKSHMRRHCLVDPRIFNVYQPILKAGLPDDLADRRIMNVRYFGEKMMLNLEVQATDQPADYRVPGGKIGRSTDLVDSPFILHLAGDDIRCREGRILNRMR